MARDDQQGNMGAVRELDKDADKGTQAQQSGGITGNRQGFEPGRDPARREVGQDVAQGSRNSQVGGAGNIGGNVARDAGGRSLQARGGGEGAYGGVEGRPGQSHSSHPSMYRGPERRRSQADWQRWQERDRRMNSFNYS